MAGWRKAGTMRIAAVLLITWLAAAAPARPGVPQAPAPSYRVVDLGSVPTAAGYNALHVALAPYTRALAMNDKGLIAGDCFAGDRRGTRCLVWENGRMREPAEVGRLDTGRVLVNTQGTMAGSHEPDDAAPRRKPTRAFILQEGRLRDIPVSGANRAFAMGLADDGTVVGTATADTTAGWWSWVWDGRTVRRLDVPGARQVFAESVGGGVIIGTAEMEQAHRPFILEKGKVRLFDPAIGRPVAVNKKGEALFAHSDMTAGARLTVVRGDRQQVLATHPDRLWAQAMNGRREVVGTMTGGSFLVSGGRLHKLQSLIVDPAGEWQDISAMGINDKGQIVGSARRKSTGQSHAIRLDPVAIR